MIKFGKGLSDEEKFSRLGIKEGKTFEIRELTGLYQLDLEKSCVYEIVNKNKIKVNGLYEHLLDGTWHKKNF